MKRFLILSSVPARGVLPGCAGWALGLWLLCAGWAPVGRAIEPGPGAGSGTSAPLTVEEIVRRSVLRDDQLRASRTTMKSDRTVRTERLDSNGKVIESNTTRAVYFPSTALVYATNVEGNGENTVKAQKIEAVMSLRKLAPRFDMTLLGEESVRGLPCYVVGYRPKASQPAAATREEKVVSNLHGRFWMSKTDFSILQSEGSLVGPVTVALVASVNQMDFKFHSQAMPNGDTGPGDFSVNMAVKAPFYDFRQRQVTTEENWRPR